MRHRGLAPLCAIAALVAAACTGSGGPPDGDGDPITVEHAGTAGLALQSTAVTARGYFELGHDLVDANCVTLGGTPEDPDGDNIPTTVTLTLDCPFPRDGGATEQVTGTITLSDPSPLTPEFRFLATYVLNSTVTDGMEVSNGTLQTEVDAAFSGSSFSLDVSGSETGFAVSPTSQVSYTKDHSWSIDYDPNQSWNPGLPLEDGAFNMSGDWSLNIDDQLVANAQLTTSALLNGSSTCGPSGFDNGDLLATWTESGSTHDVELVWSGCGDPQLTVDGDVTPLFDSILPFFSFD